MSEKPREPVTGTATTSQGETTGADIVGTANTGQGEKVAGEGRRVLSPAQRAEADEQYSQRLVELEKNRHKPKPKCSEAEFRRVRALGLSEKEELEMLGISSRSTLYSYSQKWPGI